MNTVCTGTGVHTGGGGGRYSQCIDDIKDNCAALLEIQGPREADSLATCPHTHTTQTRYNLLPSDTARL